jgi:hypothetical protein
MGGMYESSFLPQRVEQGFGLLEVHCVKALGEPAVDRREQVVRFPGR